MTNHDEKGRVSEAACQADAAEEAQPISDLILKLPLYREIALTIDSLPWMRALRYSKNKFDAPCRQCGRERTFEGGSRFTGNLSSTMGLGDGDFSTEFECGWDSDHTITCWFRVSNMTLTKVGQSPSLADIASAELSSQFRKVLGHERARELARATGLMANGIGIGSFVYLRRVFEGVLEDHRKAAETDGEPIPNYLELRVDERIQALQKRLPPFLVKHRKLYGILSIAVHELDEQTCLKFFPIVREAIFLILQQDVEAATRRAKESELSKALGMITQELSASSAVE